jgi:hypothetical protein
MKKQERLTRKIKRLLRRLGCPRWLHHFGPKKYELSQHIFAFVVMAMCKLSLRRVVEVISLLSWDKVPTYSALCKSRKRIPSSLLARALRLTAGEIYVTLAIDSTGISRANPSFHYVKRIDRVKPVKSYVKQSSLFDVDSKKFIAIRIRAKPRHDTKDVNYLLKDLQFKALLGDKAYDSEAIHESCFKRGIQTIIPKKDNIHRGFYRKKQIKGYSDDMYHRRSLIESGQGAIKRKYGGYTLAKEIRAIKIEAYCKAIAYNMGLEH